MKKIALFMGMAAILAGCNVAKSGSVGPKGDPGKPGLPGSDGKDGIDPYEQYIAEHPEYKGDKDQWYVDLANGTLGLADTGGVIYGTITGGNAAAIGYFGSGKEVKILDTYLGEPVTNITHNAFAEKTTIEKMTFGKNLTYIGESAFLECINMASIVMNDKLEEIARYAFESCDSLKTIDLPDTVRSIGEGAFSASGLTSFRTPAGISGIEPFTFNRCMDLEEVYIGDNVERIGSYAFDLNPSLHSIFVPSSVTSIESQAFFLYGEGELTINCEATAKPDGWADDWNSGGDRITVNWGASRE